MLALTQRVDAGDSSATLTLPLEQRSKGRLRVTLDDGREAGLFLERGSILRGGDIVASDSGECIRIVAADEPVSTIPVTDPLMKARACYHLGNRHVPLQIEAEFIRYQHDHVLDDMVRGLGLDVVIEDAPFEPEPGAYGGGHRHGDDDHHHHHHDHEH